MSRRILPQVETHERGAEGRDAALQVQQAPPREQAVARLLERSTAERERLGQLRRGDVVERLEHRVAIEAILDGAQRRGQPIANAAQDLAVWLRGPAGALGQLRAAVAHRQVEPERVDFRQVEAGGLPPREQDNGRRHHRGDRRVAVAVAADPEPKRRGEWSGGRPRPVCFTRAAFSVRRNRGTASQSDCSKTARPDRASSTGDGRRGRTLARFRPRRSRSGAIRRACVALGRRQVHVVAKRQQLGDAAELLHQRAACHLRRVRREHQLHAQPRNRVVQPVGHHARRDQPGRTSRRTTRSAAARPRRADRLAAGGCGDAARRCWPG